MLSHIRRSVLLASGIAVLALASPEAQATTQSGFDTAGTATMPFAINGNEVMQLQATGLAFDNGMSISGLNYLTTGGITINNTWGGSDNIIINANQVWNNGGGNLYLNYGSGGSVVVGGGSGSTENLLVPTGKVGIGTWNPQTALDANGEVRVGNSGAACSGSNAGAIRWTGTGFQGCNGSDWGPIGFSQTIIVHAPANSTCGTYPGTPATSTATCPSGYNIVGGGYTLDTWHPATSGSSNAPDASAPDSSNGWRVYAGGAPANSCFSAYAMCAK